MRFRHKLILSLSLSLFFGLVESVYKQLSSRAQPNYAARYYPTPPPHSDTVYEIEATRPYVNYSNSGGEISVGTGYIQLRGDLNDGLIMAPSFKIKGKRLKPPTSVLFEFASFYTNTEFQSMTTLRIVGDDKLVFEVPLKIVSRTVPTETYPKWTEESEAHIPYPAFERLCQSSDVEISTGGLTMRMSNDALMKFRDIKRQVDLGTSVQ
jgi:hypothetical protein